MKKNIKITLVATTLAILSLSITATYPKGEFSPKYSLEQRDETLQPTHRIVTPPSSFESQMQRIFWMENGQGGTQSEFITKTTEEQNFTPSQLPKTTPLQPTEKEEATNTPTTPTQTATKPTTPTPKEPPTPQMGDTRIVNGQKQSYFLGFGWIDDMGENECIYVEGMYQNGNKIGIMGQSDGDINKIVGTMD